MSSASSVRITPVTTLLFRLESSATVSARPPPSVTLTSSSDSIRAAGLMR